MSIRTLIVIFVAAFLGSFTFADPPTNVAEDEAASYNGWESGKGGGSGFGTWTLTTEGNDNERHAGFFIASTKDNKDLGNVAKSDKAFGVYANGTGFEQAVAYRAFEKPLQPGDSFSFMMETGPFEKRFDKDDQTPGSIGIVLRSNNANSSVADYNKDAVFEFGHYQGKGNYQVSDGTGGDKTDTGIPTTDTGIVVTVTVTGADTYDLEIQTLSDKNLNKLPGRKFAGSGAIKSFAIFDRNGEKNDAFFNGFQVARPAK